MTYKNPPNISILFVDDDPVFIEILLVSMSHLKYNVIVAYSAKEALAKMAQHSFNIVVTDIRMPEMDGFELLRIIKQKYPYTPVVALTSDDDLKSATEFMLQGGSNYIKKYSDQEELEMVLNSAIKHWFILDELRLSNETLTKKNIALKKTLKKQRETYLKLKKAKELAISAAREKSELLANLSHELRTPLHGISNYLNFLRNDNQLNANQKEKLNIIHQCSEAMGTLINNSLTQLENIPITLEDLSQKNNSQITNDFVKDNILQQIDLKNLIKMRQTLSIQDLYNMVQEGDIESIKEWCLHMEKHSDSQCAAFATIIFKLAESFQISKIESILYQYFFKS